MPTSVGKLGRLSIRTPAPRDLRALSVLHFSDAGSPSHSNFYEAYCENNPTKACMVSSTASSGGLSSLHMHSSPRPPLRITSTFPAVHQRSRCTRPGTSRFLLVLTGVDPERRWEGCIFNTTFWDAHPRIKAYIHFGSLVRSASERTAVELAQSTSRTKPMAASSTCETTETPTSPPCCRRTKRRSLPFRLASSLRTLERRPLLFPLKVDPTTFLVPIIQSPRRPVLSSRLRVPSISPFRLSSASLLPIGYKLPSSRSGRWALSQWVLRRCSDG